MTSVSGKRPAVHHLSALRRNRNRRKQFPAVRIYRLLCRGRSDGFGLRRYANLSAPVMVSRRNRVAFVRRVKRRADRSLIHHCSVLKNASRSDELLTGQYLRRFRSRPGSVYAGAERNTGKSLRHLLNAESRASSRQPPHLICKSSENACNTHYHAPPRIDSSTYALIAAMSSAVQ